MALASTTRSPLVPLTLKSGSRTPQESSRWDIAAVPTAWKTLHPINNVRRFEGEGETIQGFNVPRSVVPCVLGDLLICVRRCQRVPFIDDKPLPGPSGHESFCNFYSGNYRFDIKVCRQEIGIDDGRIERIRAPQLDRSAYSKTISDLINGE